MSTRVGRVYFVVERSWEGEAARGSCSLVLASAHAGMVRARMYRSIHIVCECGMCTYVHCGDGGDERASRAGGRRHTRPGLMGLDDAGAAGELVLPLGAGGLPGGRAVVLALPLRLVVLPGALPRGAILPVKDPWAICIIIITHHRMSNTQPQ